MTPPLLEENETFSIRRRHPRVGTNSLPIPEEKHRERKHRGREKGQQGRRPLHKNPPRISKMSSYGFQPFHSSPLFLYDVESTHLVTKLLVHLRPKQGESRWKGAPSASDSSESFHDQFTGRLVIGTTSSSQLSGDGAGLVPRERGGGVGEQVG